MKNGKHVMGICAYTYSDPDYVLMKQAGIEWIRIGFTYPFKDRLHGELNPRFLETVEHVKTLRKKGFKIMGSLRSQGPIGSIKNLVNQFGIVNCLNGREPTTRTGIMKPTAKDAERWAKIICRSLI